MRLFLKLLFGGIFVCMTTLTIRTGLSVSLSGAWPSYSADLWAITSSGLLGVGPGASQDAV